MDELEATMLIDTDVHESWTMDDVKPYLSPFWRDLLERWAGEGFAMSHNPWLVPIEHGTRKEWREGHPTKGYPSTDRGTLQRQLFEEEGVSIGILNGSGNEFSAIQQSPEFVAALASAYNDWQIDYWLEPEPRLRGSVSVMMHDPEQAAAEIDRVGGHPQIVQVILKTITDVQFGDPRYRPIFEAALRNDLAVTMHHCTATQTVIGMPRYYVDWHTTAAPFSNICQLSNMIFNGVFDRYPDLKVVILETGVAWLPWFMWRADEQYRGHRAEVPWLKRLPSEHMRDNVRVATQPLNDINAKQFVQIVELADAERVFVFASDYPHYDADTAAAVLPRTLPEELRRRIRYQNAVETFPKLRGLVDEAGERGSGG
jgi:predicted TIM-barrel fold metal-dependent hydrolase